MSAPDRLRAACYHRVSTADQDAGLARAELRAAAKARGLEVVLDVEETGSGARNDRPGWQRVLEAARRGEVGVVLVWKLDRAGRSALDLLANLRALEAVGARFVAVSQGIDLRPDGDAMSRLMLTVLAGVAEFERALIRERTKLGMLAAVAAGKRIGRPLADDAPSAGSVRRLRSRGLSWPSVAGELGVTVAAARRALARAAPAGAGRTPGAAPAAAPRGSRRPSAARSGRPAGERAKGGS